MERSLGVTSVVAIALSAMLGTGIFVLPGLAAEMTGSSVWLAFLLAAVCSFPAAAAKAEMATAMPTSGGAFVFLDRSFGPWVGTIVGISVWLAALLKGSFALIGVSVYLMLIADVPIRGTALSLLAMIVFLNWMGVKAVSRAQMFVMGALLLSLTGLVIFTLGTVPSSPAESPKLELGGGILGMLMAVGLLTAAFNGVTKVAAIAEEVRHPAKTIPWGIFIASGARRRLLRHRRENAGDDPADRPVRRRLAPDFHVGGDCRRTDWRHGRSCFWCRDISFVRQHWSLGGFPLSVCDES